MSTLVSTASEVTAVCLRVRKHTIHTTADKVVVIAKFVLSSF